MNSLKKGLFFSTLALLGCQAVFDLGLSENPVNWQQLATDDAGTSGRTSIEDGPVDVDIVNASGVDVLLSVTMRVLGAEVHLATRQIPAGQEDVFVGPDRADLVLVDVTLLTTPPTVRAPRTFSFGRDFNNGDTIRIVIEPPPVVTLAGLDTDIRVRPGMVAAFAVQITGDLSSASGVDVFADPDQIPASGDEIVIATGLTAAPQIPIQWTVPELPFGRYPIYAEVRDGNTLVRSAPTAGAVRVDAPPQLTFSSPPPNLAVTRGFGVNAAWVGSDPDDSALITIFLDTNTTRDGTEPVLKSGISASDVQNRQLTVDTSNLAPGTYFIGGLIDDGLTQVIAYAGPVCVTQRLVGRISPSDLGLGAITTLTGGPNNRLLGSAVDISRKLSGVGGTTSTVLASDPAALNAVNLAPVATGEVELYQHDTAAPWPRNLTIADVTLRMIGERDLAQTGQAIALLDPTGAENANSEILIGAPGFQDPCAPINGRAYFLRGGQVLAIPASQPTFDLGTLNDSAVGSLFQGNAASELGLGVAALGDLDGSGSSDFAIGATNPDGLGSVYLFSGNTRPNGGPINQAFNFRLDGVGAGDFTGFAIAGVADANGDGLAEVAIGAPLARPGGASVGPQTGLVYLVFGQSGLLLNTFGGSGSLGSLGGGVEGLHGRVFAGENDGDRAGSALASADFDGDGRPDLLIGAPGFAGGRGRVYLVYDVGNAALPVPPAVINLGLVGSTIAGAVFDGVAAGDALGTAVADGRDFDGDGVRDILLGAPGVESQRGAAYLIYGTTPQRLQGQIALANVGTCGLPSLEFLGEAGLVSRMGQALSAGTLHNDARTDLAVGAPGDLTNPGQVHLLFGHPPPGVLRP